MKRLIVNIPDSASNNNSFIQKNDKLYLYKNGKEYSVGVSIDAFNINVSIGKDKVEDFTNAQN